MNAATVVGWGGRIFGGLQIVLGLLFWAGISLTLLPVHMLNGLLIAGLLITAAILAGRAGLGWGRSWSAIGWALFIVVFGIMHGGILVGGLHWIIQVLHLVVGLAALGMIERFTKAARAGVAATRRVATAGA